VSRCRPADRPLIDGRKGCWYYLDDKLFLSHVVDRKPELRMAGTHSEHHGIGPRTQLRTEHPMDSVFASMSARFSDNTPGHFPASEHSNRDSIGRLVCMRPLNPKPSILKEQ